MGLGLAYKNKGVLNEAKEALEKAVSLSPGSKEAQIAKRELLNL